MLTFKVLFPSAMKNIRFKSLLFKLVLVGLLAVSYHTSAQKTTVWIVRHAEKEMDKGDDPGLTPAGQRRANDLLKSLKHEDIAGIYVTSFKRTLLTAKPTAAKYSLVPEVYDPANLKTFTAKLFQLYKGHSVLIVGHSNTILPTLTALGAAQPFSTLTDDDYDMLFKVTIKNNKTELEISYYGEPHHTTEIPEQYLNYTKEHFISAPTRF
jgi:broad specificity phosphatase PhoE